MLENLSGPRTTTQKLKNLGEALKKKALCNRDSQIDFAKIASSHVREGNLNNESIKRVIFYLRGFGCSWSLSEGGGCFMCGHFVGTSFGRHISPTFFVGQFRDEFIRYDYSQHPMICVYNAGSFFNEDEMPTEARKEIYRIIAQENEIKSVIFESRPEYISLRLLREIEENLPNKRVEIGIGLETADDFIRETCVNKGFTLEEFKKCASLFSSSTVKLLTYVTVKPLFLTTKESIDSAVQTAKVAIEYGSDIISLEPISLQEGTMVEHFFNKGQYSLPKGWDIVETVQKIDYLPALIRIGGFEFYPAPKLHVQNCTLCNQNLFQAISDYNKNRDIQKLNDLSCRCKAVWESKYIDENEKAEKDLEKRIELTLVQKKGENTL